MKPTPMLRASCLVTLSLLLPGCGGLGEALANLDNASLSSPMVLNDTQQSALTSLGAALGQILGASEYSMRNSDGDQQIEAVKKARSYQNDIEVKGKTKDLNEVVKQTEAVLAVPVTVGATTPGDGDTMEVILVDPVTHKAVDGKIYTVPKLGDNTLFQLGKRKVLYTTG